MKANKVTVTIKVEALSIDILRSMLMDVAAQVDREILCGHHEMDDGDRVEWKTESKPVEF